MFGYIYITTNNINNKRYIGKKQSTKFISDYFGSGTLITRAVQKYGTENFTVKVLEQCNSLDELNECEKKWIKFYNAQDSDNFYNIAPGGDGGNLFECLTEQQKYEFRKQCSQRCMGKNNPNYGNGSKISGDKNPAKRPEVRKKISEAISGEKNGMYGKTHTPEATRKRIETTREKYGCIKNQFSEGGAGTRKPGSNVLVFDNFGNFVEQFDYLEDCMRHYEKLGLPYSTVRNAYHNKYSIKPYSKNYPYRLRSPQYEKYIGWWFVKKDNTEVIEMIKNISTP